MYCYPEEITDDLLYTIKKQPKACHYLDLPIQHINDEILKKMGRRTSKKDIIEKIDMIRSILPDAALRTTLISGFPGETKDQHDELLEFVKDVKFDRLGVFPYSEEEGTAACNFPGMIDDITRQERAEEIMKVQSGIIFEKNKSYIGSLQMVFVEGYLPEDETYVGRTYRDAPDIDGYVFFSSDIKHMSGDLVWVKIQKARQYDLVGEELS